MTEPRFLSLPDVLQIHADTIAREGGQSSLRDVRLLESAMALPRQALGGAYLHEDVLAMAAAYLYHLTRNHPFVDGNKRTGAIAAFAFLDANGFDLRARPKALQDVAEAVAAGEMDKAALADWFRGTVRRRSSR